MNQDEDVQYNLLDIISLLRQSRGSGSASLSGITAQDLQALLANSGITLDTGDDNDDDDDYEEVGSYSYYGREQGQTTPRWYPPVTEPQEAGKRLLQSGDFGPVSGKGRDTPNNFGRLVGSRFPVPSSRTSKEQYAATLVPNTPGTAVALYGSNIYTAQFSKDSSFYYTCAQGACYFRLHIYDTTVAPHSQAHEHESGVKTRMPVKRAIKAENGSWTITDANLSPDNERMVYSSITSTAHVTSTVDARPVQVPIEFSDNRRGRFYGHDFGIYSCRFSADGNEIVAGGSGKIFVYDLLADKRTVKINAHGSDVNSSCWADTSSGNVLVSASDDSFLKVWDRRSLGASRKPSGVLVGHTEGITNVSAKGDGRYIISNGKDQALRLWDLRKMRTSAEFEALDGLDYGISNFDYRYPCTKKPRYDAHPQDCSVMTYRGHAVMRTLIRCHFSPAETTGSQYIYSGSSDGKIHIWSLDGRVVQVLDRSQSLAMSFDPSAPDPGRRSGDRGGVCVRDLSWHSQEPVLMSAAWGRGGSIVARHEWKGLSKCGPGALEDWNEKAQKEWEETMARWRRSTAPRDVPTRRTSLRSARVFPGAYDDEEEDSDFEPDEE